MDVVKVLNQINNGEGQQVYGNNSRGDGEKLGEWSGKLDMSNIVVGGHSFGATSALDTLTNGELVVRAGLLFDP